MSNGLASKQASFEDVTEKHLDLSFNTGFYPTFYLMQKSIAALIVGEGGFIPLHSVLE
ncbi:hypothetical protein X953_18235 [Virgibacillus sp. SK37]|nr:hypothetical protein X953_18235 [Virgibacillus sp. SK37]